MLSGFPGVADVSALQMQMLGVCYVHDIRENMLRQAKQRLRRAGVRRDERLKRIWIMPERSDDPKAVENTHPLALHPPVDML